MQGGLQFLEPLSPLLPPQQLHPLPVFPMSLVNPVSPDPEQGSVSPPQVCAKGTHMHFSACVFDLSCMQRLEFSLKGSQPSR